jgi:hypothetical protein
VQLFFGWSSVINLVIAAPSVIDAVLEQLRPGSSVPDAPPDMIRTWVTLILLVGAWIFVTRVITLLPGIAMGRRMLPADALAETRGHFWFIVGASILPMLPVIAGAFAVALLVILGAGRAGLPLLTFVLAPAAIFVMLLGISISARLSEKFSADEPPQ